MLRGEVRPMTRPRPPLARRKASAMAVLLEALEITKERAPNRSLSATKSSTRNEVMKRA
jgi:hypothetical protein